MAAVEQESKEPGKAATWKCVFPAVITTLILLYFSNNYFKKVIYKLSQESTAKIGLLYSLIACKIIILLNINLIVMPLNIKNKHYSGAESVAEISSVLHWLILGKCTCWSVCCSLTAEVFLRIQFPIKIFIVSELLFRESSLLFSLR